MENSAHYKGLPLFYLDIDEADGSLVDAIAFVKVPAIERNFLTFSEEPSLKFSINEERREILGPVMVPDMPIFRKQGGDEFYVKFSSDVIRKISQVFFKEGYTKSLNLSHTDIPADAFISQSFITDEQMGIVVPEPLGELPEGTWIACVKVLSDSLWNDIKTGKYKGFSVEGVFKFMPDNKVGQEYEVLDLMKQLNKLLQDTTTS